METHQRRLREVPLRSWAASRESHFGRGRRYARKGGTQETGFREMLMQQCIASGLILFVALTISFMPLSFASNLRGGVKRALSEEGSADSLLDAAGGLTDRYEVLKDSIKMMFEGPASGVANQWQESDAPMGIDYSPGEGIPPQDNALGEDGAGGTSIQAQPGTDVRIDENVLRSINSVEFYEVDEGEKKR